MNLYINHNIKMVRIISLEGNIGAGKTTILNELTNNDNEKKIVYMREPVDLWEKIKDKEGETILSKFYKDPNKYAFSFQIMAFTTRLSLLSETIRNNPQAQVILCERSLEADNNIFAKLLYEDGVLDEVTYKIYMEYFQNSIKAEYKLSGIIYINTKSDVCFERINQRNREGESKITKEYLQKCDIKHKEWMLSTEIPVLEIESDFDKYKDEIYKYFNLSD